MASSSGLKPGNEESAFTHALYMLRRWSNLIPMIILAILVSCAIFAPQIAPRSPVEISFSKRLAAPAWYPPCESGQTSNEFGSCSVNGALLGTDILGRDVLSRIIYGTRTSLGVAILSIVIAIIFGTLLGLTSSTFHKSIGVATSKRFDALYAIAYILGTLFFGLMVILALGFHLVVLAFALALGSWIEIAAHISRLRIPNTSLSKRQAQVVAKFVVAASVRQMGLIILAGNMLSYLGVGVQPPMPSWGVDISRSNSAWWVAVFPTIALFLTALSFYLVGTRLRDRWVVESAPDTMAAIS